MSLSWPLWDPVGEVSRPLFTQSATRLYSGVPGVPGVPDQLLTCTAEYPEYPISYLPVQRSAVGKVSCVWDTSLVTTVGPDRQGKAS
eukprot:1160233-Pelagomonas_calceolata.AAC.3